MNDVIINKIVTIERCLERINIVYAEVGDNLSTDFTRQDSMQIKLGSSGPVLSNATAISSDERLKKNIVNIADGQLAKINALTVREFEWKNPNSQFAGKQEGFIAQEVEAAAKKVGFDFDGVSTPQNETDLYGIRYAEFVVPLVKAMQEQQAIIEQLKERIEALEK
jgi:hypothetical protein